MSSLNITQGTQSAINFDLNGTINTQVVAIGYGTISTIGTLPNINIASGSINGTINIGNTPNIGTIGTLGLGTITGNLGTIGTLGLGSVVVNTLPNLPGGTLNAVTALGTLGTVGTITNIGTLGTVTGIGSVNGLGTLPGVGVVTNITNGSIIVTAGTVVNNGGSAIAYGPAAAAAAAAGNPLNIGGTDSGGTIRTIKVDSGGLQRIGLDSGTISVLPNLPQGSINVTAGTIASVGTIGTLGTLANQGSLTNLGQIYNAGTIQGGTIQINQLPIQGMTSYGTMGTQGSGTTFLTIQGTVGAGTECIVSDWSIIVMAGTCGVSLSFGTNSGTFVQGTGVIDAGSFPAGGGLAKNVDSVLNSGTNGAIYAGLYGNGTAYYKVSYYKATTTI